MDELTDEQIAEEEKFLKGLPRVNIGALVMPGRWGPCHGFWACILFYPLMLLLDHVIYGAYVQPEVWSIALAVVVVVGYIAACIVFSIVSQPFAAHRAEANGVSREQYLKRERIWAIVCVIILIVAVAWATYYNLAIRLG